MLREGGLPATIMQRRLYDLDLQPDDMAQVNKVPCSWFVIVLVKSRARFTNTIAVNT